MLTVSARTLNILAAFVWYGGGVVLLIKGIGLLQEAELLRPEEGWPRLAGIVGLIFGGLKAKFLFSRSCRKNLVRIAGLTRPRIWQFYRPWFFAVLAFVSLTGAKLSRMAQGDYVFLMGMAVLDLSIAVALLGSSHVFWREKAFTGSAGTGP